MRMKIRRNQLLKLIIVVGFFIGIIIANKQRIQLYVFNEGVLKGFTLTEVECKTYLRYVIFNRVGVLVSVCFFSNVKWKYIYACMITLISSIMFGVVITAAFNQCGIKGSLFCLGAMFPHMVLYGLAYWIITMYWLYYPSIRWNAIKTVAVILFMIGGITSEVYLNVILLKWMVNFMM